MVDGPSHRDSTAPVVRGESERDVGIEAECADDIVEVADAGGVSAQWGAFAESHAELINRDHAVAVTERAQECSPRVGPCRVAMDTDHRGDWRASRSGQGWTGVENMPAMRATIVARHIDTVRPRRVDPPGVQIGNAGQVGHPGPAGAGAHQTISV